jgi:hypothetical protein
MKLLSHTIECKSRNFRYEIFPFGDCHIGKRNCAEGSIGKQVKEVIRRSEMPNRGAAVLFGGDIFNAINPVDIRRFDFDDLADWFLESDADSTRERLSDMTAQELKRVISIFNPIKHLTLGAITGNHENMLRKRQNIYIHKKFCENLNIADLTDEALIRLTFNRGKNGGSSVVKIYIRHGYGGGRTAGAEPNKIYRMMAEWQDADVCLTGHSHTFSMSPPEPVLYVPNKGKLPERLLCRNRFGANWGCWLYSHHTGPGSYESAACYPARPMSTLKIVIWPFWRNRKNKRDFTIPKIEIRDYPIL